MRVLWFIALLHVAVAATVNVACPTEFPSTCICRGSDTTSVVSIACTEAGLKRDEIGAALTKNADGHLPDTLEDLTIRNQEFTELPENFIGVENYDEILSLDLSSNKIMTIKGKTFHHMFNLERLILDNNDWIVNPNSPRVLSSINSIRVLSLRHAFQQAYAQTSVQILQDVFRESSLRDLEELILSDNGLAHVSAVLFQDLPELALLDLSSNRLTDVEGLFNATCRDYNYSRQDYWNTDLISRKCYLEELNLSNNSIHTIPMTFITELQKMQTFRKLNINNNKLICDCDAIPFIEWLNGGSANTNIIVDKDKLECAGPSAWEDSNGHDDPLHLIGEKMYGNTSSSLLKKLRSQCGNPLRKPSGDNSCPTEPYSSHCSCIKFEDEVIIFNCTNQNFRQSNLTALPTKVVQNVEELILTGNNFPTFHLDDLIGSDKSKEFDFLYTLVLSNNRIVKLGPTESSKRGPFQAAADMERLILDDNELDIAGSEHEFLKDLEDLEYLSLKNAFKRGITVNLSQAFIKEKGQVGFLDLEYLNLEDNGFDVVESRVFQYLPELRELRLGFNNIRVLDDLINGTCFDYYYYSTLDPNGFHSESQWTEQVTPCNLKTLSLVTNAITMVPSKFLKTLQHMLTFEYLDISNNPFDCGCGVQDLHHWLKNDTNEDAYIIANKHQLLCNTPTRLFGRPITSLTEDELKQCNKYYDATKDSKASHSSAATAIIVLTIVVILIVILGTVYYNRLKIVRFLSRRSTSERLYYPVKGNEDPVAL